MKKIFAIMMLAATVAACTVEDMKEQPVEPQFYTMTVKASKGVDTKALSLSGNTLNATWAGGETVTVKEGDTPLGALTAYVDPEDNTKATLKGNLNTAPSASGVELTLEFNSATYGGQDGTLGYIAQNSDYAKATTTITVEGNTITGTAATFENQNAIAKFTLNDKVTSNVIRPSKLVVSISTNDMALQYLLTQYGATLPTYTFTNLSDAYSINGGDMLYFAMPTMLTVAEKIGIPTSVAAMFANYANYVSLNLTATVGSETYIYTRSGYPFEAGKYYDITVNMTKQYRSMDKATTNDIGKVIGANGKIYVNAAEALAAGTTAKAMIAYVGAVDGVCTHGLAISLSDVQENNATFAEATGDVISSWATNNPVPGGIWRIPSEKDWQYMMWGYYADSPLPTNISDFQTKLGSVGLALANDKYYWTSTEDTYQAKTVYYDGIFAGIPSTTKTQTWRVRACLAF